MGENSFFSNEGITRSDRVLHTPSSVAKKSLLYVQEVGTLKSLSPHWSKREQIESYLLFLVKSGSGVLQVEGEKEFALEAGDLVWVDCRRAYGHCSSENDPWELCWVHFDGTQAKAYFDFFMRENGSPVFRMKDADMVCNLIDELKNLQNKKDIYGEFESAQILVRLMTMVVLEQKSVSQMESDEVLEKVRIYVTEHYLDKDLYGELSTEFGLEPAELKREFLKRYGIELRDYILNRKFTMAKEMLRFSVKSIPEVVEQSGIENTDLFYQLFRENENMSPEEYRGKWAGWIRS